MASLVLTQKYEMINLNKDYREIVDDLKTYLEETQIEVNLKESQTENKESVIDEYETVLFENLDSYIRSLENIASVFNKDEHNAHKQYFQMAIHPVALKAPFNRRCFEKPLGYPGDYLMMEMIYSDPYQGESLFTKLLNTHSLSLPIVEAVRNRSSYIGEIIKSAVTDTPDASILNVGSGPAWEIREFLRDGCNARFYLLDQEKNALEFVRKRLDGNSGSTFFLNEGIKRLIKLDFHIRFDLIYSTGLFDYLSDRLATRLIESLYGLLKEEGKLIIANARYNPQRVWMEHGVEWYLRYRNREELLNLAEGLYPVSSNIHVEAENMGQLFIFLIIKK